MGKHFHIEVENDHEALVAMLAHLNRESVRYAVDRLIEQLDTLDGDPDLEEIDEREPDCDGKGDVSWPEWHTRGRRKVTELLSGSHEPMARHDGIGMAHEDDEDDDAAEEDGEDRCTGGDDNLTDWGGSFGHYATGRLAGELPYDNEDTELNGDEGDYSPDGDAGGCPFFGIDQTKPVSEGEAFHDLNGIPLIRVPAPESDQ